MRTSSSVIAVATLATGASAQMIPALGGSGLSPLVGAMQVFSNLSSSCQSVLTDLVSPSSNISQCLQVQTLIPLASTLNANSSLVEPIDSFIQTLCSADPCSNATISNFTQSLIEGCSADLEQYNINSTYIEFAMSQYPLAREVLCLNTTTPEWDQSLLNETMSNSTTSSVSASASSMVPTAVSSSTGVLSGAASIATAPAVSAASVASSLLPRQLASSASSAALADSTLASMATSSVATAAAPSATGASNSTSNSTMPTNSTSCAASVLGQVEEILGTNLTILYIYGVVSNGSYNEVLQNITSTPKTALCDDCIFGAVDLVAESWPALVNLTITQNYTVASFLNSTCEATVAPYNVTYDGELPETINATAVNSTFAYNITSLGNNQTTNATAPTTLPPIPVFDKLNNATSSSVSASSTSASASSMMPTATSSASIVSASASSDASVVAPVASVTARNIAAVKGRWFGQA